MSTAPVRCTAKYPDPRKPDWVCNERLGDAIPRTVLVRSGSYSAPGTFTVACPRCGALYTITVSAA